ncbi:MAG: hypothetical protein ABI559_09500 [Chloroflexota bacterium]
MNRQENWLRPAIPVGAILFLLLLALGAAPVAHAQDNTVRTDPSGVAVAPGGTFHIGVVDDPPEQTLSAWVIELTFDPAVVSAQTEDCVSISTPGGAVGAFDCQVTDDNKDGTDETVKMLGAVLFSRSQKGLVNESKLADITFHAVGGPGTCSDLRLRILIHADSNGDETNALVQDGRVCIAGGAPASGTASPFPVTPRTSEPTPMGTPGAGEPSLPNIGGSSTGQASGGASPGATGATGSSAPRTGGTAVRTGAPTEGAGGIDSNDGGGSNTVVWVILGVVVLAVAGGGAWAVVRMRKPGGGPSAGPPEA